MLIDILPSNDNKTKYTAYFNINNKLKKVKFGAFGYGDYPHWYSIDPNYAYNKKINYIKRHSVNEKYDSPYTKSSLSLFILWNKPTIKDSIKDYINNFFHS